MYILERKIRKDEVKVGLFADMSLKMLINQRMFVIIGFC